MRDVTRTSLSLALAIATGAVLAVLSSTSARRGRPVKQTETAADERAKIRACLADLLVEIDPARLPPGLRRKGKPVDREALFNSLPRLDPPLSATIIEERGEEL